MDVDNDFFICNSKKNVCKEVGAVMGKNICSVFQKLSAVSVGLSIAGLAAAYEKSDNKAKDIAYDCIYISLLSFVFSSIVKIVFKVRERR